MRYLLLVAWREYSENAKTKGFWIGLCMFPLIWIVCIKGSVLLETRATPTRYYALVDKSGAFASNINARLAELKKESGDKKPGESEGQRLYQLVELPPSINTNADFPTLASALKPYLRGEEKFKWEDRGVSLYAALFIPRDIEKEIVRPRGKSAGTNPGTNGIEYWAANLADTTLRDAVEKQINDDIRRQEYIARGMDVSVIREVERTYAPFESLNPNKEAGKEKVGMADVLRQWAPSGFVYLLWVSIFTISQMLLNNIVEEKSNRIIEVLLSSVTPSELMLGKLLGIAAIGLTMVGFWISVLLVSINSSVGGGGSGGSGGSPDFMGMLLVTLKTSNMIPMFAIYFILGYLMYAAFILALGSVCNTIKEAQNYVGMITMLMMVPLVTMTYIPKDPNGTVARVLSWIPLYTPFTMMNRVNANPPTIDVVGTLILLFVTMLAALWMAGKIFRIGILRTGQPPKILELLRWLKG